MSGTASDELVESAVRIRLLGANPHPRFEAMEPLPGRVNYLIGKDPAKYHRNVPIFSRIKLKDVYPGIDLVYYGTSQSLEYDLVAAPGSDTSSVKFAIEGPVNSNLDADGDLVIATAAGSIVMRKPRVYQRDVDGSQEAVEGSFVLAGKTTVDAGIPRREVSFDLASYDHNRTLVIDPGVQVVYSTYLGGTASSTGPIALAQFSNITGGKTLTVADAGLSVALDSGDKAYVTGVAYSNDFPTASAFQAQLKGFNSPLNQNPNSFIAKFDYAKSGAASLIFSTYVGGQGDTNPADAGHGNGDLAFGIAADASGQAFIVGQTYSTDFPLTSTCGAFGRTNNQKATSTNVGFVAKLKSDGSTLLYSCYIDGSNNATESRVALFPAGCGASGGSECKAYVTGSTQSDQSTGFPVTNNAFQSTLAATNGKSNATFLVVHEDGQSLDYATLYGGAGNGTNADSGLAVAVDSSGDGFITGGTFSSNLTVPGAQVSTYAGGANKTSNVFVAEFDPAKTGASSLLYGTYLGGSGAVGTITGLVSISLPVGDVGTGIAVDNGTGDVWVTGLTASTNFQVPGSSGTPFQSTNQANASAGAPATAAFITQLNPKQSGTTGILYSSYFSGTGTKVTAPLSSGSIGFGDAASDLAFAGGKVYLTGLTTSGVTTNSFPLSSNACYTMNKSAGFSFGGVVSIPITSFVTELDPSQNVASNQLVFSTLLGGSGMLDAAGGLRVDSSGKIVVAGLTYSTDFPVTPNAFQFANKTANQSPVKSQSFLSVLDPADRPAQRRSSLRRRPRLRAPQLQLPLLRPQARVQPQPRRQAPVPPRRRRPAPPPLRVRPRRRLPRLPSASRRRRLHPLLQPSRLR